MKIYMLDGRIIDLPCAGLERLWHHCKFYGICECGEETCRHWRDVDWECRIMCE